MPVWRSLDLKYKSLCVHTRSACVIKIWVCFLSSYQCNIWELRLSFGAITTITGAEHLVTQCCQKLFFSHCTLKNKINLAHYLSWFCWQKYWLKSVGIFNWKLRTQNDWNVTKHKNHFVKKTKTMTKSSLPAEKKTLH